MEVRELVHAVAGVVVLMDFGVVVRMNFSECRYYLILKFYLYILLCSLDENTCDVVCYNLVVSIAI